MAAERPGHMHLRGLLVGAGGILAIGPRADFFTFALFCHLHEAAYLVREREKRCDAGIEEPEKP